jgi:hypothetical protein
MLIFAGLVGSSFILVSLVVGGRLLLLGLRSGRTPELTVGFGLFAMGGFGCPLMLVSQQAATLGDATRAGLALAATSILALGEVSLAVFTQQVFRPKQSWARAVVGAFALAFAVCVVGQAVQPGYAAIARGEALQWLSYRLLTTAVLLWSGVESLHYARVSARRQRIGLSDRATTNRFLLWAGSTLICAVLSLVTSVVDPKLSQSLTGVILAAPVSLAASVSLWFAFLPPRFYVRWLSQQPA